MSYEVDGANFKIKDNSKEVLAAMEKACEKALTAVGLQAVGYAEFLAPVDTGLLRNSLTYALDGEAPKKKKYKADEKGKGGKKESGEYSGTVDKEKKNRRAVYIGTNVEYAPYQEYGTSKTSAQPFIRPAASEHNDEYAEIIKTTLEGK